MNKKSIEKFAKECVRLHDNHPDCGTPLLNYVYKNADKYHIDSDVMYSLISNLIYFTRHSLLKK